VELTLWNPKEPESSPNPRLPFFSLARCSPHGRISPRYFGRGDRFRRPLASSEAVLPPVARLLLAALPATYRNLSTRQSPRRAGAPGVAVASGPLLNSSAEANSGLTRMEPPRDGREGLVQVLAPSPCQSFLLADLTAPP
jgi:hypothetical protein